MNYCASWSANSISASQNSPSEVRATLAGPDQAREWYSKHLGLADKGQGIMFPWREHDDPPACPKLFGWSSASALRFRVATARSALAGD
jgi:hypothetical protein